NLAAARLSIVAASSNMSKNFSSRGIRLKRMNRSSYGKSLALLSARGKQLLALRLILGGSQCTVNDSSRSVALRDSGQHLLTKRLIRKITPTRQPRAHPTQLDHRRSTENHHRPG